VALALVLAVPACGGGGGEPEARPSATQTTVSPTPSPTPTLPPVATDKAAVKKAVVTAADLGKPWVEPKAVNTQKQQEKGDLCPGQKSSKVLYKPRASEARRLTEGTKAGAAIGSFAVRTYGFGFEEKWRAAFEKAARGCKAYRSPEGTYVTTEIVASLPAVDGADEVLLQIERIYADKTKKTLYYVRHYYEARSDRYVSSFELAYVQPKGDPTGKDTKKSAALLAEQVAKTRKTFGLA
jgi:hypothetical protein